MLNQVTRLDPADVAGFRRIAAAVVVQAANDLREKKFRREAQVFLTRDLWGGWSVWLDSLPRGRVVAFANASTLSRRHHRRHGAGSLVAALRKRARDAEAEED